VESVMGTAALAALVSVLLISVSAPAAGADSAKASAVVPAGLLAQAQASPAQVFHVIVQGTRGSKSSAVAGDVSGQGGKLKKQFLSISGVAADLSGKDLVKLARSPHVLAITPDAAVVGQDLPAPLATATSTPVAATPSSSMWPASTDLGSLWQ